MVRRFVNIFLRSSCVHIGRRLQARCATVGRPVRPEPFSKRRRQSDAAPSVSRLLQETIASQHAYDRRSVVEYIHSTNDCYIRRGCRSRGRPPFDLEIDLEINLHIDLEIEPQIDLEIDLQIDLQIRSICNLSADRTAEDQSADRNAEDQSTKHQSADRSAEAVY